VWDEHAQSLSTLGERNGCLHIWILGRFLCGCLGFVQIPGFGRGTIGRASLP
jgi:hypothetical protein